MLVIYQSIETIEIIEKPASTGPLASGRTQGSEPVPWMTTCQLRLGLAKQQVFHKEIWDSNGKNDGLAYKSIGIRPYNLRLRY